MHEDTRPPWLPPLDGELSALIARVCDGLATPGDAERLEQLLQDPAARLAYVAFTRLNADLRWRLRRESAAGQRGDSVRPAVESQGRGRLPSGRSGGGRDRFAAFTNLRDALLRLLGPIARPARLLAAAAVVGGVLAIATLFREGLRDRWAVAPPQQSRDRIVAHITAMHEARWRDARRTPDPHLGIPRGTTLDLVAGFVEVTFAGGATVLVNGPALLTVQDSTAVHVHRGAVSARFEQPDRTAKATANAQAGDDVDPLFVVHTPSASVIDLGTEFGVRVADDGTSDVLVYAGLVEIEPHRSSDTTDSVRLTEGDARRVNNDGSVAPVDVGFGRSIVRSIAEKSDAGRRLEWVDHEAETIYFDGFDGDGPLAGRRPSSFNGHGNAAWETAGDGWEVTGGRLRSTGHIGSASLPFLPEVGVVYRLSTTVHSSAHKRGLAAIGFLPVSTAIEFWKNPGGYAWIAQRAYPDPFKGGNFASGRPSLLSRINDTDAKYGTHIRMVQLDTREPLWRAKFFVDGQEVAWFVFDHAPPIAFASLSFNTDRVSTFDDFRLSVWRPRPDARTARRP